MRLHALLRPLQDSPAFQRVVDELRAGRGGRSVLSAITPARSANVVNAFSTSERAGT